RTIVAAEKQSAVARPSCVVVRPLRVPQQDVAYADSCALTARDRSRRQYIGVLYPKTTGERFERGRCETSCDDDSLREDGALRRAHAHATGGAFDSPHRRSFEDGCAESRG